MRWLQIILSVGLIVLLIWLNRAFVPADAHLFGGLSMIGCSMRLPAAVLALAVPVPQVGTLVRRAAPQTIPASTAIPR